MRKGKSVVVAVIAGAAILGGSVAFVHAADKPAATAITVYKDANCGCCKSWVDHLRKHAFRVTAHDASEMDQVKTNFGVPSKLHSCHTAVVAGYVIEGHVPAADIRKLLKQRPRIAGLAVPGMPMGSPGMEGPRTEPYETIAFERNGKSRVFARH